MKETKEMTFDEKVRSAMNVAQEWLDVLSKIDLTDEDRAVKAMEVSIKLLAQLLVFELKRQHISYNRVANVVSRIKLEDEKTSHDSIRYYALAETRVGPEILGKLYKKLNKTGAFKRVENKTKTIKLSSAIKLTERLKKTEPTQ
jgi:hypothetical protein